jgi:hypothetical protein
MIKRLLTYSALIAFLIGLNGFAQDTNKPAAGTNAPPAAPADTGPKPDAAGTATGLSVDAQSPSGTFVVNAPAELSDDDKKDPAKVKTYQEAKKAFEEYTAQAKLEPLAVLAH